MRTFEIMGKTIGRIQWTIVALLWVYIVYRAVFFAITEDEAYSYFLLKSNAWRALPGTVNTHWLNTFFMRLFLWLPGGDRPYKLRLLSVGSWWVFAYSVIKLCGLFKNKWIGIAFFSAAILNPFLVFYFSLSRGYSAGCAFSMLSLWQAACMLRKGERRPAAWISVVIPASVAVLANFSFFYFFIGLTVVYLGHLIPGGGLGRLRERSAWGWWIVTGGTFLFAAGCLLFIRFHSLELAFAEYPDLVRSSFGSLVKDSLWYDASPTPALLLGGVLFAVLLLFSFVALWYFFRSGVTGIGVYSMNIFVVILLVECVFHLLFKISFLYGRTALVIYVVLLPGVFGMADTGLKKRGDAGWARIVMGLGILLLCFNFYKRFNLKYFYEWPVQEDTEKCLDRLVGSHARKVGMGLWHRDVFIFYYAVAYPGRYGFSCELVTEKDLKNGSFDRFDHLLLSVPLDRKNDDRDHWKTELYCPRSGAVVLARDVDANEGAGGRSGVK
jgi:hypothetical protein